ncbi:helix-turn-helix domain-containing protein [Bradyrhizobium elkanii]|uniref:helix-turn-helix domain-containing protein n=1 Tax=Bradyrhizobium elkanii TaxID=29448 RepID=UPI003D1F5920
MAKRRPPRATNVSPVQTSLDESRDRPTPKEIGARVRQAREAKGWTQARLAREIHTTQQTIEKIELGKVRRTSFLIDIYEALGIQTDAEVLVSTRSSVGPLQPMFGWFPKVDKLEGAHFKVRRETLGLKIADLANIAAVSSDVIEQIERTIEGYLNWQSPEVLSVAAALDRLEWQNPAGEPASVPGYAFSALPATELDVPFFAMGPERGIFFQYFGPLPSLLPRLRGFFCLTAGKWGTGMMTEGERYYCQPLREPEKRCPHRVLIYRSRQAPREISEIICGDLLKVTESHFVVALHPKDKSPTHLKKDEWNLALVGMAFRLNNFVQEDYT